MNREVEDTKRIKVHYYLIACIIIWIILNMQSDYFNKYHVWDGETYYDQSGFGASMLALFGIMCIMFGLMIFLNQKKFAGKTIFRYIKVDGFRATLIMFGITLILAVILYSMIIII